MSATAALSLVGVVVTEEATVQTSNAALAPENVVVVQPAQPTLNFSVERASDMFLADFTFYGFTLIKKSGVVSLVATATQTSTNWIGVIVQLPPQHIGEGDYWEVAPGAIPFDPAPVLSQVAGPSRLAFTFAHGDKIPLPHQSVDDLLDWSGWNLNVAPTAQSGSGYALPISPTALQTWIECPLALILSPVTYVNSPAGKVQLYTQFRNRTSPMISPRQVVECWTTTLRSHEILRLTIPPQYIDFKPSIAAVWATDYATPNPGLTSEQYIYYDPLPPPIP